MNQALKEAKDACDEIRQTSREELLKEELIATLKSQMADLRFQLVEKEKRIEEQADHIADITLSEVPFERNRLTRYSGQLFGALRSLSLTVDDEWMEDYEAEW